MIARITLFLACGTAAAVAVLVGNGSFNDWRSQLFWLSINILIITLAVGALLDTDLKRRRRRELQFAFQTRLALLMQELIRLTERASGGIPESPVLAIGKPPSEFARRVGASAQYLSTAKEIRADLYNEIYGTVWSMLEDLNRNFIRLFSRDHEDMLDNYQRLFLLSRRWRFVIGLTSGEIEEIKRLEIQVREHPENNFEVERLKDMRERTDRAKGEVLKLLVDTADLLLEILRKSAGSLIDLAP